MDTSGHPVYLMPGNERKEFPRFPIVIAWNGQHHFVPTTLSNLDKIESWKMGMNFKHLEASTQYLDEINPQFTTQEDKDNFATMKNFVGYMKTLCKKRVQDLGHTLSSFPSSTVGPPSGDIIFTPKMHSHTRGYGLTAPTPSINFSSLGGNLPINIAGEDDEATAPKEVRDVGTDTYVEVIDRSTATEDTPRIDASVQTVVSYNQEEDKQQLEEKEEQKVIQEEIVEEIEQEVIEDEIVEEKDQEGEEVEETEEDFIQMDVGFPLSEIVIDEEEEDNEIVSVPSTVATGEEVTKEAYKFLERARQVIGIGNKADENKTGNKSEEKTATSQGEQAKRKTGNKTGIRPEKKPKSSEA